MSDSDKAKALAKILREKVGSKDYYSPKETLDDLRYSIGAGETATNAAKLVGKSLFNVGKFVGGSVLPSVLESGESIDRARAYAEQRKIEEMERQIQRDLDEIDRQMEELDRLFEDD